MITKWITALVVILFPFSGYGQWYTQYFDGADTAVANSILVGIDTSSTNVWQIGPPQKTIFNTAATLPNAIVTDTVNNYPPNNTSRFRIKVYNTWAPWGILALQWMQKLDLDSNYDGGIVEFSVDHGITWQNAFNNPYVYNFYGFDPVNKDTLVSTGDVAFSGRDTSWSNIWLCFDLSWMSMFPDTLHLRYTLKSDSADTGKEGWLIDNMIASITFVHTVSELEQKDYMTVTPNPTSGRLDIAARKMDEFHIVEKIELVNIEGKVVQKWGMSPTKFYVDISNHPDGIYFLNVTTNIETETFKILLKR